MINCVVSEYFVQCLIVVSRKVAVEKDKVMRMLLGIQAIKKCIKLSDVRPNVIILNNQYELERTYCDNVMLLCQ